MNDSQIVILYFRRDENAIIESQKKYHSYCYSIANNILHNHEDTLECVNDTWIGAWNSIPPHKPTQLSTFLGKLTRRISLKRWRSMHTQKRGGGEVALALEELVVDDAITEVQGNKKIRTAIVIRDYGEGYPELKTTSSDLTGMNYSELMNCLEELNNNFEAEKITEDVWREKNEQVWLAMNELKDRALDLEAAWLTELGAEDLSIESYETIVCTLKKNTISELKNGKCNYVVIMSTQNLSDVSNRDIASYYGKYDNGECIYIPSFSSYLSVGTYKLLLNEDSLQISSECGTDFQLSAPVYERLDSDEVENSYYQMEPEIIEQLGSAEMLKLIHNNMIVYQISDASGNSCLLYLTNDSFYIDLGLHGIIKF